MVRRMYSIYDRRTKMWLPPMTYVNDAHVRRDVRSQISRARDGDMLAQFPEDYEIHYLGEFDDSSGIIAAGELPECVCRITDLVVPEKEDGPKSSSGQG